MSDSPDITKVINLLMQNPEIISNIGAMLSQDKEKDSEQSEELVEGPREDIQISVPPIQPPERKRSNRAVLLGAMKPYLRSTRASAIDSMISILEVLDAMKGR